MDIIFIATFICYLSSSLAYGGFFFVLKKRLNQVGFLMLVLGFIGHTCHIGYGSIQLGYLPVQNLHETLIIAAWAIAGVFIALKFKFQLKILGVYSSLFITVLLAIASQLPSQAAQSQAVFKSFWLVMHILFIFIGEAAFALACGAGILYLAQERSIKSKQHGFLYKRLPSLDQLDSIGYVCLVGGFCFLTLGLITGLVYAKLEWKRFWSWDYKEVWSGISWLLYAGLLHQRLTVGWRGRRAAIMAIIGFVVLVFTFLGVNLILGGHHNQFTPLVTP